MNKNLNVGNLIYDGDIYDGHNTFIHDLQFYKKWMPKNKDAQILELCCGTGRLTIPIAKDGHDICGVDIMSSMLEQAKKKAAEEDVEIEFIEADIRTLDLPRKFDLIFIPFNSIHHLYTNDDLFKTLRVVRKLLKEEGLFLLDCFNPDLKLIVEGEKEKIQIAEYRTGDGRDVQIEQSMHYDRKTQVNHIAWHYYINGEFDSVQDLDMRLFFPQELDSYLEREGFETVKKFGNFQEEAFVDGSDKQIFVCRK